MNTFVTTCQILNDKNELEIDVTVKVYNLDGKEAHDTMKDVIAGVTQGLSGFDPVTGATL